MVHSSFSTVLDRRQPRRCRRDAPLSRPFQINWQGRASANQATMHTLSFLILSAAIAGLYSLPAHASCGAAFCSLNTDLAAEAAGIGSRSTFDLRYEHIVQDQPRSGSNTVGVGAIRRHHDEVRTRNRNLIGTYSHAFESGWGVSVTAPLVDREHLHIHNHRGAKLPEEWNFRELGDLRVTGRYQRALSAGDNPPRMAGFLAGLKLPTGRTNIASAAGDEAERTLQPGTGTTDLVLGAFFHQQLPRHGTSCFAQAQIQHALNDHDGYRPGNQLSADLGVAKTLTERLSAIAQLNAVVKRRDSGITAEPVDSGSRSLYLSPGISYQVTDALRAYAFYQHPLYQEVNGVQLTSKRAIVVGVSTRF